MTPEQQSAHDRAQVMLGFAQGKAIQYRQIGFDNWATAPVPNWEWTTFEYRLAPERREVWVGIHEDKRNHCKLACVSDTPEGLRMGCKIGSGHTNGKVYHGWLEEI